MACQIGASYGLARDKGAYFSHVPHQVTPTRISERYIEIINKMFGRLFVFSYKTFSLRRQFINTGSRVKQIQRHARLVLSTPKHIKKKSTV